MKITKRQLKRIIREEKRKLHEQQSPGDRAMGLYADMKQMGDAEAAMEQFMEGVINAAAEDANRPVGEIFEGRSYPESAISSPKSQQQHRVRRPQ